MRWKLLNEDVLGLNFIGLKLKDGIVWSVFQRRDVDVFAEVPKTVGVSFRDVE